MIRQTQTNRPYRKPLILLMVVFCSLQTATAAMAVPDLARVIEGIRATYGDLSGLSLQYQREVITRSMTLLGKKARGDLASGHIYFKPPHFLKLQQEKPQPEIIITDGTFLWWYIPPQNKAYQYSAREFGRELHLLTDIFRGMEKVEDNFQVLLHGTDEHRNHTMELIPDPPWQEVDRIDLTVTPEYEIREIRIHNLMGTITVFELEGLTEKGEFPEGFFRLDLPEEVELIREGPTQ